MARKLDSCWLEAEMDPGHVIGNTNVLVAFEVPRWLEIRSTSLPPIN